MNRIRSFTALLPIALLFGCSNPAKDVAPAVLEPASNPASNTAAVSEPEGRYFAFGPKDSAIAFIGSKVTRSHNGGFRNFAGELKVVNGQVAGTGNKVVIDTSSLFADDPRLTGHLKGPDFFGVAQYPTATFISTAMAPQGTNWTVTGDLTLHGVTKSISFPAKIEVSDDGVHVTSVFKINRNDFGIVYPGMANDLIRQDVVLSFNVKAASGRADFAALEQAAQAAASAVQSPPRPGGARPPGAGPPPPGR